MESKSKVFGHPAHTLLIAFPLGLLSTSVIFDTLHSATQKPKYGETSFWMLISGIFGGLVSAPFGWWDWKFIPEGTRAKRIGRLHGWGNVIVLIMFGTSAWIRRKKPETPGGSAKAISLGAGLLAALTGWLGGELVNRLSVGVDDGANLDASNSLSGELASQNK